MLMQRKKPIFTENLSVSDPELFSTIEKENKRQEQEIELIASENITSLAVMQAQGSVMTNKYAEGYSGKRYYGGCEFVDLAEDLAIKRIKELFNCEFANVQPNSGSQANQAVFMSLMKPGDTFLAMDLASGGHLTHGAKPNLSGKWFNAVHYGVNKKTELIDYAQVEELAKIHQPKVIIAGGSAIPRQIDFKEFRRIADAVGAFLMVDMAHFSGLAAAGCHPNPLEFADVATSTTHKTLRGPRGGIILTNNVDLAKKFNSAVFPGLQGGPLMHVIAGKAAGFGEALKDEFKVYSQNVVKNAKILSNTLIERGINIVSGGTDNHIVLVDLRNKGITGNNCEQALERAGITCNKNGVPFDETPPSITSGIRLGSSAATTRGLTESDFKVLGNLISDVICGFNNNISDSKIENEVNKKIIDICKKYPIY